MIKLWSNSGKRIEEIRVIKLWSNSGKRVEESRFTSTGRLKKNAKRADPVQRKAPSQEFWDEPVPSNIIDYEALLEMYNEHHNVQYEAVAAVGDETSEYQYAKKQKNLKFLSL